MKKIFRFTLGIIVISFLTVFSLQLSSCDEDELDNMNGDCTGCPSSAPWSKPGSSNCYATQEECEANEGPGCVICN